MDFRTIIKEYAESPISRHLILELLSDYQSPNDKISELLKSKELMVFADGSKKADWDVGLAVDVVKMAPRLDTVVILSGDSDFVPLVEYLQEQMMVRVEVASFGRSTGLKLKEVVDAFYDLADKPEKYLIGYRKPRRNTRAKRPVKKIAKK